MNIFRNDAYQLSMLYAQWVNNRHTLPATAEAFYRRDPYGHKDNVLMAGAYRINHMLNGDDEDVLRFRKSDMDFVQSNLKLTDAKFAPFEDYLLGQFNQEMMDAEVLYLQDGEPIVPNWPAVQVNGTTAVVHMLETPILSILNTNVRAATIARTCRLALGGSDVKLLDFSTRRQDDTTALHVAIGSYIGGFDGTSNLDASRLFDIPSGGTMAHSFVLSYGMNGELRAFKDFLRAFPDTHALLIDTFDILRGTGNAIRASIETGISLRAVRIDSGDQRTVIPQVRSLLNSMGFEKTMIVVSGDYNPQLIQTLKHYTRQNLGGVAYDSILDMVSVIGIGSYLGSPDFSMGFVYKLVEISGEGVYKKAGDKSSFPGKKVWYRDDQTNYLLLFNNHEALEDPSELPLQSDPGWTPLSLAYLQEARTRYAGAPRKWVNKIPAV